MSDSFDDLVGPHRAAARLHCYRMLGSSHDGEDMVQETFVRAFRSFHTLSDKAAARGWLMRIATNVCLDELARRPRRFRGTERGAPSDPTAGSPPATPDEEWLEPVPSSWVVDSDPGALYSTKESVALAFVAALQVLTPAQRAVLLLRDVVGLSAEETADALGSSVSSANSALHRARVALEEQVGPRARWSPDATGPVDRDLLERYMRAWESGDLDTIVALLHEEVTLSMPPVPRWVSGRDDVARFFETHPRPTAQRGLFRTAFVQANGTLAAGFYRVQDDGSKRFFAMQLIEARDGLLARIDHFMGKSAHRAFFDAGLAPTLP